MWSLRRSSLIAVVHCSHVVTPVAHAPTPTATRNALSVVLLLVQVYLCRTRTWCRLARGGGLGGEARKGLRVVDLMQLRLRHPGLRLPLGPARGRGRAPARGRRILPPLPQLGAQPGPPAPLPPRAASCSPKTHRQRARQLQTQETDVLYTRLDHPDCAPE